MSSTTQRTSSLQLGDKEGSARTYPLWFCTDLGGCYPEGTSLSQEWGSNVVLESGEIHSFRIRAVSEPLLYARHESSKGNQNKTCS